MNESATKLRSSRPSLRATVAGILDAVGVVDAALVARRLMPLPFLPIVTYHRVSTGPGPGLFDDDVVDATADEFEHHVEVLARSFHLIGIDQLRGYLYEKRPLPPNPAMITFDDGYRECHDVALPILRRHGVRATFFVATSFVTDRRMFWWDKISYLVKRSPRRVLSLRYPFCQEYALGDGDRSEVTRKLLRIVKDHYGLDVERFVEDLAAALGVAWTTSIEETFAASVIMTWDEVRALHAAGMDIESHTRTHRILHTLAPEEIERELLGSRNELEEALDCPVNAIAYPVGGAIAPNARLCAAVAAAGYDLGFSSATGTNLLGDDIHPYDVRRIAAERAMSHAYFRASVAFPNLAHLRPVRASSEPT
jgi:peptidoglycan/xylan/chitin deacetylase (PgdA/CDA1 family)